MTGTSTLLRTARFGMGAFWVAAVALFAFAALPGLLRMAGVADWAVSGEVAGQVREILIILTPLAIYGAMVAAGASPTRLWAGLAVALGFVVLPNIHVWAVALLTLGLCLKPNGKLRFPQLASPAGRIVGRDGPTDVTLVIGLALVGVALRVLTIEEPFERDLMIYAAVADGWLRGAPLYAEMWDHKPPGVHSLYAIAIWLFGLTPIAIFALNAAAFLVTLTGVLLAATRIGGSVAGLPAVLIWVVLGSDPLVQANQPNVEVFLNASLIWAVALLLPRPGGLGWRSIVGAGVLFLIASSFKQVAIFTALSTTIALILSERSLARAGRAVLKYGLVMGLIGAAGWAAVFSYYYLRGDFDAFRFAVIEYNRYYAGNIFANWANGFEAFGNWAVSQGYAALFLAAAVFHLANWRKASHLLLLGAYLGAFLAFAAPGRLYAHYFQLFAPLLAVTGGYLAAFVVPRLARLGVVAAGLVWVAVSFGYLNEDRIGYVKYGTGGSGAAAMSSRELGKALRAMPEFAGSIYHWGADPGVYFWQGGGAPVGLTYNLPLEHPTEGPVLEARLLADLIALKPKLVVARAGQLTGDDAITRWVVTCHVVTDEFGAFPELVTLLRRTDAGAGC